VVGCEWWVWSPPIIFQDNPYDTGQHRERRKPWWFWCARTGELGIDTTSGQKVARIKPLLLPQGLYTLELTADDGTAGPASSDTQEFVVKTPLKLGNLSLPVTDLTVQGHGLPITISRSYDSGRANNYDSAINGKSGDFGPGWRLEMPDTDMRITASASRITHSASSSAYPAYFPGDVVYFTLPGGQSEAFQFSPQYLGEYNQFGRYYTFKPSFKALGGSTSRLTVDWGADGNDELRLDPTTGERYADTGTETGGRVAFNPARDEFGGTFLLTTKEGTQFDIDAKTGMVRTVSDANGNTLQYEMSGAQLSKIHSFNVNDPASPTRPETTVTIHRRTDGRIDSITDDSTGRAVTYAYNASFSDAGDPTITHPGELRSVTSRSGATTKYGYSRADRLEYHLTSVTDPRGLVILSATYDPASGELTALKDPYKKSAPLGDTSFAGSDARKGVTDLSGNKTEMVYDFRGRVVREIKEQHDAAGKLTGYLVSLTGYQEHITEDQELGRLAKVLDYQPFTINLQSAETRYFFTPNSPASTTVFDEQGNVVQQIDGAGRVTTLGGYGNAATDEDPIKPLDGKPTSTTDAYGNTTHLAYEAATGNLHSTTDSANQTTLYEYDDRGNTIGTYLDCGTPGVLDTADIPVSKSAFDGPLGQMTSSLSDFRRNSGSVWVPNRARLRIHHNPRRRTELSPGDLQWIATDMSHHATALRR